MVRTRNQGPFVGLCSESLNNVSESLNNASESLSNEIHENGLISESTEFQASTRFVGKGLRDWNRADNEQQDSCSTNK